MSGHTFIQQHKAAWAKAQAKVVRAGHSNSDNSAISDGGSYAIWQAACKHDWDALKAIPDHADRNKRKPFFIDKYRDYLSNWISSGGKHQNDVLVRNLIWSCDSGQWEYALELCDVCVDTGQAMTLMERTCATFFLDSIVQFLEKNAVLSVAALAVEVIDRIENKQWEAEHIAIAKLYRIIAKREKNNPSAALIYAQKAHHLYPNVGVKTLIQDLQCQLKTSPPPQAAGIDIDDRQVSASLDPSVSIPARPVLTDTN